MLSPFHPMQLAFGLLIWSAWFGIAYGGLSVACSVEPPEWQRGSLNLVNIGLIIFTLIVGAWLLYAAYRCWRALKQLRQSPQSAAPKDAGQRVPRRFIASLAVGVNLVAGLATLLVGGPLLVLAPCLG